MVRCRCSVALRIGSCPVFAGCGTDCGRGASGVACLGLGGRLVSGLRSHGDGRPLRRVVGCWRVSARDAVSTTVRRRSEGRLVAARVESDGKLVTVTESQVGDFLTNRVTAVEMARENSFQVSSLEADSEAIADVPQHLFPLKPEGMARGTHLHTAIVRDWMILDPLEKPVRPTTVYYRCGGRLS